MINFRFHVVSLIAIFLALALGVVIGAGVIERGLVDTLNNRLDRVEAKSDRIQGENDKLRSTNDQLKGAIEGMQPDAVSGRLVADDVGVVAVRGVDGDQVKKTVTAAQQAGANVIGTLWIEGKWKLDTDDDVKAMQTALGTTTRSKTALRAEAWRELAQRFGAGPADGASSSTDVLNALQQAGFLGFDAAGNAGLTAFPGRGAGIALVVGTHGAVPASALVMPAATALHAAELPLVVADVYDSGVKDPPRRAAGVQPVRDSDLARTVSTVDDLDLPQGPATVVLALSDLFLLPPKAGHFGYGPNAQPLPDPVTT